MTRAVDAFAGELAPAARAAARLDVVCAADVQPMPVEWLWPARLPRGKLVSLDGDPGLGKSTLTIDVAARVSMGLPMPGERKASPPGGVVFVTFEDGAEDTIVPRLMAASADRQRCYIVRGIMEGDGEGATLSLGPHAGLLEDFIQTNAIRLVVVDPINAALGAEVDGYKDQDVRRALAPLARAAETTGATVIYVRHLTKGARGSAAMAGGGSVAFIAAARVGLFLAPDPNDREARVLSVSKSNLGPLPPSLRFRPSGAEVETERGPVATSRLTWLGECAYTADDLNAARADMSDSEAPREEVDDWLRAVLADGARDSREVMKAGREAGFADRTLRRRAKALGVVKHREGQGLEHRSLWSLPPTPATVGHSGPSPGVAGVGESGQSDPFEGAADVLGTVA